jgi:cytochrome c553
MLAATKETPSTIRCKGLAMKKIILPLICVFAFSNQSLAADATKGQALYSQRCAMCHGDKGAGDGPLSATLPQDQKPRNLASGQYKYATDDTKLKEIISKGGAAVGLSVLMPAQSDLNDGQLNDLVAFLKSLKK